MKTKTEIAADKADFELHVQLLIKTGVPKSQARMAAWLSGPTGLQKLLGQLDLNVD